MLRVGLVNIYQPSSLFCIKCHSFILSVLHEEFIVSMKTKKWLNFIEDGNRGLGSTEFVYFETQVAFYLTLQPLFKKFSCNLNFMF
jgi:hypothetical protein